MASISVFIENPQILSWKLIFNDSLRQKVEFILRCNDQSNFSGVKLFCDFGKFLKDNGIEHKNNKESISINIAEVDFVSTGNFKGILEDGIGTIVLIKNCINLSIPPITLI